MKRLSERRRRWLCRHALYNDQRRIRSQTKTASRRRSLIAHQGRSQVPVPPPGVKPTRYRVTLPLPEDLSLTTNYEGVLEVVKRLRQVLKARQRCYVDFRPVRHVGPGAALLITAELDRWRRLQKFTLSPRDLEEWDPAVLVQLDSMGLFDVLDAAFPYNVQPQRDPPTKFIKFRTGTNVAGSLARELRLALEETGAEIVRRGELFAGLTEAMANVVHHAYPEKGEYIAPPLKNRWWMCGAYNAETSRLSVQFIDQGVGIPATLTRKHPMEHIRGFLTSLGLDDDDAARIRVATLLRKSGTLQEHRGRGLSNMRAFVEESERGKLRILSGRGQYLYDTALGEATETHATPLGGTLIEWEILTSGT